jgi:hypothetical protein
MEGRAVGQILHGSARTTEAVRRAIQYSQASLGHLDTSRNPLMAIDEVGAGLVPVGVSEIYGMARPSSSWR